MTARIVALSAPAPDTEATTCRHAAYREVTERRWSGFVAAEGRCCVPEEVPLALRVNCADYAVMLASPVDLEDFAYGFLFTEGLIKAVDEVAELTVMERAEGIVLRVLLDDAGFRRAPPADESRRLPGATGCGLCGVQNLREAMRPVPRVAGLPRVSSAAVARAVAALRQWQPLNASVGALHAAAFADADGAITLAREDVGRHNALDKLIGALLREGRSARDGFVVMSSRCSYELVQKAARFGVGMLCTVSAPTALAIRLAEEAGMTLVSRARTDAFAVFSGEHRLDW